MSDQINSQNQEQPIAKVRIFATGGCGINIGANFENYRDHTEAGMAMIDTVYIDTSRSNLKPNLPTDKIFILPDMDGSGKERRQNSGAILKHVKEMLQKHKPGYVNVVLSSASGGSGSVISAVLAKELLDQDQMVIAVTVGVADSGVEIKNTLDTLKSYEAIAAATKRSIPVAYFENNKTTSPTKVDEKIMELLVAIAVMFSRQNEGLDSRDMYNFLNFDRMTDYKPHASGLETYVGDLDPADHESTMTVASAVTSKDNRGIDFVIPYTCYGVLPSSISKEISDQSPIHLATKAFAFNDIARKLAAMLNDIKRAAEARTAQSEVLSGSEELDNGFLVL